MALAGYSLLYSRRTLGGRVVRGSGARGGSIIWVFSTTLLMLLTENRFRGRVFAAECAFHFLVVSMASFAASAAIDYGVPVRQASLYVGLSMLIPLTIWLTVLPFWRNCPDSAFPQDDNS